jgi:hypothetical protein
MPLDRTRASVRAVRPRPSVAWWLALLLQPARERLHAIGRVHGAVAGAQGELARDDLEAADAQPRVEPVLLDRRVGAAGELLVAEVLAPQRRVVRVRRLRVLEALGGLAVGPAQGDPPGQRQPQVAVAMDDAAVEHALIEAVTVVAAGGDPNARRGSVGLAAAGGDDVDDAHDRVGAVDDRRRPVHDLDVIDHRHRDRDRVRGIGGPHRVGDDAVDHHQEREADVGAVAAPVRLHVVVAPGPDDVHARQIVEEVEDLGVAAGLELLAREAEHHTRRPRLRLEPVRRGDDLHGHQLLEAQRRQLVVLFHGLNGLARRWHRRRRRQHLGLRLRLRRRDLRRRDHRRRVGHRRVGLGRRRRLRARLTPCVARACRSERDHDHHRGRLGPVHRLPAVRIHRRPPPVRTAAY